MRISLVIPTYNRRETLRRCLAAALAQDLPDYEVIVVDDASTDGTEEMVPREFPQVRYLRQERNRGPAAARNRGLAVAQGEIIAFTDDDCLLPPDFLSRLLEGYRQYPQVVGVGGYLLAPDHLLTRNPWAQYEAYMTRQVYRAGDAPYVGGYECPAGGTNAMSYRRSALEAVGGFDESFPVPGGEDAELKWRMVQAGGALAYLPIRVIHLQPYTWRSFWRQYRAHGRGVVYFERKRYGAPPSWGRLVLRAGVRLARWPRDVWRLGPRLGTVGLVAQMADLCGQWSELRRLRCGSC